MFEELLREIEANKQANQNHLKAMIPHFETEEEALKYAVRLANLQPGDRVKAPFGTALADHVFYRSDEESAFLLLYDPDTKSLRMNVVAPIQIVLD